MADQNLLTIFLALTALAILIQTGILIGLFFVSSKLNRQAERALDASQNLFGPLEKAAENLRIVSERAVEFGASGEGRLRKLFRTSVPSAASLN